MYAMNYPTAGLAAQGARLTAHGDALRDSYQRVLDDANQRCAACLAPLQAICDDLRACAQRDAVNLRAILNTL